MIASAEDLYCEGCNDEEEGKAFDDAGSASASEKANDEIEDNGNDGDFNTHFQDGIGSYAIKELLNLLSHEWLLGLEEAEERLPK